ncbi:M28 family metallopeptidase [Brevibacillus choshinensis]|uniref:M28 family peptidase n=1 Tax=Brevibacillus choshinensis TaxID=54911 RepID=A0ABX7FR66_BRECH|nr:M28 family metallopeptidase [Brevibacillus choshinensis]QRG68748.1 M28 family peptidase [Brevibacillus choshinensis]
MGNAEAASRKVRDRLIQSVDAGRLDEHVRALSKWDRLTGEPGAEMAVDYIMDQLSTYGITGERHRLDMFCSDPIYGEVQVTAPETFTVRAKSRSFCGHFPEGVCGDVIYDRHSQGALLSSREEEVWISSFKDKIVLSWNYYEDYVQKLEQAGAKGLIHIWPTAEEYIHEETVGPIWGTPTPENAPSLPKIPVVGVTNGDGRKLLALAEKVDVLTVSVKTELQTSVKTASLPVAVIPGQTEEFLLLSGHYDSWHLGATDNAVGNALCLEVARAFAPLAGKLKRGIKIAWWPGHSNARYAGSAWYCDHQWQELQQHCVAHINVDFPGTQGGINIVPRSTGMEDPAFLQEIVTELTGEPPRKWAFMPRGADQSFWGVDIPIHLGIKYEPAEGTTICAPGCAGGWWWHTEGDTYDKVDVNLLHRDTKLHVAMLHEIAERESLPIQIDRFLQKAMLLLEELDDHSAEEFSFGPIYQAIEQLRQKWQESAALLASARPDAYRRVSKRVGGGLNRLMFSYSSPYDYDHTFPFKPFPGLHSVKDTYRSNTAAATFLFRQTRFVRQRNRLVQELHLLTAMIDSARET